MKGRHRVKEENLSPLLRFVLVYLVRIVSIVGVVDRQRWNLLGRFLNMFWTESYGARKVLSTLIGRGELWLRKVLLYLM